MPISCGALNNDNPDDENTDDDGEKEDQIEDGGDGGKRGVLYCRSPIKVKFSTDQVRLLKDQAVVCSLFMCHHAQKPENGPISDLFNLTPKYFLLLLPYTDLVPRSTDPVPPSTNQYRPLLIQYHQVPTSIAPY